MQFWWTWHSWRYHTKLSCANCPLHSLILMCTVPTALHKLDRRSPLHDSVRSVLGLFCSDYRELRPITCQPSSHVIKSGGYKEILSIFATNSALVYESQLRVDGGGGDAGPQPMSTSVQIPWHGAHCRSTSIFNLWIKCFPPYPLRLPRKTEPFMVLEY